MLECSRSMGMLIYILAALLCLAGVGFLVSSAWIRRPGAILLGLSMLVAAEGTFAYHSVWPVLLMVVAAWPLWRLTERA